MVGVNYCSKSFGHGLLIKPQDNIGSTEEVDARCLRSRHAPAVGRDMDRASVLVASPISARSWAKNAARMTHERYADVSALLNAGSDNRRSSSASVTLTPGTVVGLDLLVRPTVFKINGTCLASGST